MFHYCLIMKGRCLGFSVNSEHPPQPQKVVLKPTSSFYEKGIRFFLL